MTRLSLLGLLAAGMTLLAGCPIFDDGPGNNCWDCGSAGGGPPTTTKVPGSCGSQLDCSGINETCGSDGMCHTGDCSSWGCVNGQQCLAGDDQKLHCTDGPGHGGTGGASQGGASQGGTAGTGGAGGTTIGPAGGTGGTGGTTIGPSGGAGGMTASGGAPAGGAPAGGAGGSTATGGTGGK